jgi:hypothetical protein
MTHRSPIPRNKTSRCKGSDFAGIAPNSHIKAIPAESNPHERAQPPDYRHIVLEPQPARLRLPSSAHWRFAPCAAFARWRRQSDKRITTAADKLAARWCTDCEVTP